MPFSPVGIVNDVGEKEKQEYIEEEGTAVDEKMLLHSERIPKHIGLRTHSQEKR